MHIVVAVDGSKPSRTAIEFLGKRKALKEDPQTSVSYVNVQYLIPDGIRKQFHIESIDAYYEAQGQLVFEDVQEEIQEAALPCKKVILHGEAASVLAEEAEKENANLIVMGSRGHGKLLNLIIGSVSNELLARTQKPVLLLHTDSPIAFDPMKVAIAVDGSAYGEAACDFIINHPEFFGKDVQITVINCVPDFPTLLGEKFTATCIGNSKTWMDEEGELDLLSRQQAAFEEATDPIVKKLLDAGFNVKSARLDGIPHKAIAWYCQEHETDMIICGSHGSGGFERAVLGTTAMHLAADSKLPLLVIRKAA